MALAGPDARAQRLVRCHRDGGPCERLVRDLLEAAGGEQERRALALRHERWLTDPNAEPGLPSGPEQPAAAMASEALERRAGERDSESIEGGHSPRSLPAG